MILGQSAGIFCLGTVLAAIRFVGLASIRQMYANARFTAAINSTIPKITIPIIYFIHPLSLAFLIDFAF